MSTLRQEPVVETTPRRGGDGEPAWDVALLFPLQGRWSEADYLAIDTNRMVELADGRLEVLSMPTLYHQLLVQYFVIRLDSHVVERRLGQVAFAPLPVRLFPGTFREPDIVFLRRERVGNPHDPVNGADLVVEVVSDGSEDRRRDLVIKRNEYARAGIAEYWIVDPQGQCVLVLVLEAGEYRVHQECRPGGSAASVLLPGFQISVDELFAAGSKSTERP
ncbi:MAG: Uma2 family endonuclease [Planctomycetota bacterium]|nr:Uma2 family endonuclease [Planctomycetota bacterium]